MGKMNLQALTLVEHSQLVDKVNIIYYIIYDIIYQLW